MTLTIQLPDEQEALLRAKAQAEGVSAEQYALQVLGRDLKTAERPRHISEVIREIWRDVQPEAFEFCPGRCNERPLPLRFTKEN
jgi:plasmid stability protein